MRRELRARLAHFVRIGFFVLPLTAQVGSSVGPSQAAPRAVTPAGPAPSDSRPGKPLVGAGTPLPILQGAAWAYFKGTVEPPTTWNTIGFDDGSWLTGPSGFGYGDGDDATVLSDMQNGYLSVYTRRQFDVPSVSAIPGLELTVNWDDGFVAFINGQEIARRNLAGTAGTVVARDTAASFHAAGMPETIPISSSVLVNGTNVIAVQAHNVALDSGGLSLAVELRATNPPPAAPTDMSPADGATGVPLNPNLCVTVSDPNDTNLSVSFFGRKVTAPAADPFTIIALPDTQYYSQDYPSTYTAQTQWILDNRVARNIVFVTQLGDCVNVAATEAQWINADAAWALVENPSTTGLTFGIPYGIAVGNHDQTPGGDPGTFADEGSTTSLYNAYFGASRFSGRSYYGGHYGINNDNHYELFQAGGMDFVAIHMEFMPVDTPLRQAALDWADGVLKAYPDRRGILTSHYLINPGDASWGDQGSATWEALKDNHNLSLMFCGHLDQANRRYDEFTDGSGTTRIHTMVSDYQTVTAGGNGWLRILTFHPDEDRIDVETYSPTLGIFIDNHADNTAGTARNRFSLAYDMPGGEAFAPVAASSGASGSEVCVPWPSRQASTTYEWYAVVSDGVSSTAGSPSSFTTRSGTCSFPSDCNDGNACTADDCVAGSCQFSPIAGCCATAADCNDGNACTADDCVAGTCVNTYAPFAGCCTASAQCNDGNPCTTDTCVSGNVSAMTLDGTNDYVSMGAAAGEAALGARAFTLEAWVKRDGASWGATASTGTGGVTAVPLVTKGRGETDNSNVDCNYFLGITTTGRLAADFEQFSAGGGWNAGQNHPGCSSIVISDQAWHHVAVTYSTATGWTLYVDGVAGTTADGTTCATGGVCNPAGSCPQSPGVEPRYDSTQHFALGSALSSVGVPSGYFAGMLDEVRVWNRVLSAAEILAGKDQEITSGAGLLGRWDLNENSGTAAADSTVPAQNGTLTESASLPVVAANGPSWSGTDRAPIAPATCQHVVHDADGDAVCDALDCAPNDPGAFAMPGEAGGLRFEDDKVTLTWVSIVPAAGSGTVHQLLRGTVAELPVGSGPSQGCLPTEPSTARATDMETPASGGGFWYLVRGKNSCGAGPYGFGSGGVEETSTACP